MVSDSLPDRLPACGARAPFNRNLCPHIRGSFRRQKRAGLTVQKKTGGKHLLHHGVSRRKFHRRFSCFRSLVVFIPAVYLLISKRSPYGTVEGQRPLHVSMARRSRSPPRKETLMSRSVGCRIAILLLL